MLGPDPLFALRALFIGTLGTGKSHKMLECLRAFPRAVLFDTQGRYLKPEPAMADLLAGFDTVESRELESYLRDRLDAEFSCVVYTTGDLDRWFEAVCRLVRGAGEITFAVDEARLVMHQGCGEQALLVINWRGDHVRLLANTQRPAHLHTDLRAAASHWFVFKTTSGRDLESMAAEGVPVYEAGVESLPERGFLYHERGGRWYRDLTAARGIPEPAEPENAGIPPL